MRFIPLKNSRFSAIVDDEDYEKVVSLDTKWAVKVNKKGKPISIQSTKAFGKGPILLHRFVMGFARDNGLDIDHKFGNIFDNRRSFQLRWATRSQNVTNSEKYKDTASGHKNISLRKDTGQWRVQFSKDGKVIYNRSYDNLQEAIEIRNKTAKKLHGEYTRI